jgi:hypothetical protein
MTVLCATVNLMWQGDVMNSALISVLFATVDSSAAVLCATEPAFSVLPLNLTSPSTIEVHHKKETIPVIIYFPVNELHDDKHSF